MVHGHYPLQALLYAVALHRTLRWRLPDYDPATHLGSVLYLFVRGMAGPDTPTVDGQPCGVFAWDLPAELVTATSDLLHGAGGASSGESRPTTTDARTTHDVRLAQRRPPRAGAVQPRRGARPRRRPRGRRCAAWPATTAPRCCSRPRWPSAPRSTATSASSSSRSPDRDRRGRGPGRAVEELAWPDPAWQALLESSPLVSVRPRHPDTRSCDPDDRPLSAGRRPALPRPLLALRATRRRGAPPRGRTAPSTSTPALREALDRLLPAGAERPDRQRLAVATGVHCVDLTVIAGGPGTGKTHTVARLLALLHELADGRPAAGGGGRPDRARPPTGSPAALRDAPPASTPPRRCADGCGARGDDPAPAARLASGQPDPVPPRPPSTSCRTRSSWSTRPRWSTCR
jgi:hypothetical protein